MKGKGHIISSTARTSAKGTTYYDVWLNIEGYEVPYRLNAFADRATGRVPEKGNDCIVYIDQDQYCHPVVRIRF